MTTEQRRKRLIRAGLLFGIGLGGFVDGIVGPELMERMRKQAARFGTEIVTDYVTNVDLSSIPFKVSTASETYTSNAVIISTMPV